ncbi:disease resistance-like protein DSC1 isoform X1 [Hibiscus syriacus]|nr:disease resistance-like protein DSC1 isoform X1 [Hibiscus syriacus]
MHDMLEEMGKDIVRRESKDPGQRSRLWISKDVYQVLKYNKGTDLIEGIKLDVTQIDNLQLYSTIFEKMHNLKYIIFGVPQHMRDCWNEKLLVDGVDNVSLPDELRYLCWEFCPFKSLPLRFNPKYLVVLKLQRGNMEQLWNEDDHLDLVNLRELDLLYCKKLRKIPSLVRAINLKKLDLQGCESLIELPCLNHLSSLNWQWFKLEECYSLSKFPELPNNFVYLKLEKTGIEEVPDSIEHLVELATLFLKNSRVKYVSSNISKLKFLHWLDLSHCPVTEFPEIPRSLTELDLSGTQITEVTLSFYSLRNLRYLHMSSSSIQKLQCNVSLSGSIAVDVSSPILRCKSLGSLAVDHCEILKLLSELPPYLWLLDAHGCSLLENVSFMDQNLYQYHSSSDDDDDDDGGGYGVFFMLFSNCFSLNQDSVDNIESNAMLNIGSLAEKWAFSYDLDFPPECVPSLICCFPGNKISSNKFEYQSLNSSINLEIAPNSSRNRFLGFAVCLVADLTPCHDFFTLKYFCEYELTAAGGCGYENFETGLYYLRESQPDRKCTGDHVLILSSIEMFMENKDFEEASFEFYIISYKFSADEETETNYIKVKKCGVHVFYVDAESDTYSEDANTEEDVVESTESFDSDEMSNDESNRNLESQEDANVEEVHAGDSTETRHGDKRRFIDDGDEGDAEPKRLK